MLFDTHLHLSADADSASFLAAARGAGVSRFLLAGTSLAGSRAMLSLAGAHCPGVFAAAGVHPHEAAAFQPDELPEFAALLADPLVVAVGEIGLDFHYDFSPRECQGRVFAAFLDLAVRLDKPVVIHCREAFDACHRAVLEIHGGRTPLIIHSFTGTPDEAEQWLAVGAYLSYNGMVTFQRADNIRASLAVVPPDRLLLETDSPYLAPVPFRGKPNCSAYLPYVAARIAQERQTSMEEIARLTTANARRAFRLTE